MTLLNLDGHQHNTTLMELLIDSIIGAFLGLSLEGTLCSLLLWIMYQKPAYLPSFNTSNNILKSLDISIFTDGPKKNSDSFSLEHNFKHKKALGRVTSVFQTEVRVITSADIVAPRGCLS